MPAYKDDNGLWRVSFYFTDWTGKRIRKMKRGFKRKKDALDYEREFKVRQQGAPDMLFASLYKLYIEDCGARLRPTTMTNKKAIFNKHILPYFGNKPVNKITPRGIRKWQNAILQQGHKETYIKTLHNQLSAVFNFACKYYNLRNNPTRLAGAIGKKQAPAMKFWTLKEFEQFIKAFAPDSLQALAFNVLFYTGLRSGELLALTRKDYNSQGGLPKRE